MLGAEKTSRTCEETVHLGCLRGAEEGEVLQDPLNFQGEWEGLGQGGQAGQVREKHTTVSSQGLSQRPGNCSVRLTKDHLKL